MSFDTIRQEITTCDETALRRLIAYAVVLQDCKSGQLGAELARKLDNPDPVRWIPLEELDRRLGLRLAELQSSPERFADYQEPGSDRSPA